MIVRIAAFISTKEDKFNRVKETASEVVMVLVAIVGPPVHRVFLRSLGITECPKLLTFTDGCMVIY